VSELVTLKQLAQMTGWSYEGLRYKAQIGRIKPVVPGQRGDNGRPSKPGLFTTDCVEVKRGYRPPKPQPPPKRTDRPCCKCTFCRSATGYCLQWRDFVMPGSTCNSWRADAWRMMGRSRHVPQYGTQV
jgi:hypothetical protein